MKQKLLLLLVFCMATLSTTWAQTKEKGFFVEASAAYASTHSENYAIITPAIGYQFSKQWSAGMKVGFETGDYAYTIYTPFVRFNFLNLNKLNLFTEAHSTF